MPGSPQAVSPHVPASEPALTCRHGSSLQSGDPAPSPGRGPSPRRACAETGAANPGAHSAWAGCSPVAHPEQGRPQSSGVRGPGGEARRQAGGVSWPDKAGLGRGGGVPGHWAVVADGDVTRVWRLGTEAGWQQRATDQHGRSWHILDTALVPAVRPSQWPSPVPRSPPLLHAVLGTGCKEKAPCCRRVSPALGEASRCSNGGCHR